MQLKPAESSTSFARARTLRRARVYIRVYKRVCTFVQICKNIFEKCKNLSPQHQPFQERKKTSLISFYPNSTKFCRQVL